MRKLFEDSLPFIGNKEGRQVRYFVQYIDDPYRSFDKRYYNDSEILTDTDTSAGGLYMDITVLKDEEASLFLAVNNSAFNESVMANMKVLKIYWTQCRNMMA